MREILKYFVKNISSCFLSILISLLFVSLFIPKLFAQPSSGILTLSGDNSGFVGTFIQSSGTTTVRGEYFSGISGISSIEASVLKLEFVLDV